MATFTRFHWTRCISSVIHSFGVLWLIVEAADYFISDSASTAMLKSAWWLFCIVGATIGVVRAWPARSVTSRVKGTDVVVTVRVGDIMKLDGALLVGSNTTFDTDVLDGTISLSSVQGQFTNRYFYSVSALDEKLNKSLRTVPVMRERPKEEKPYGKTREYENGTVAPVSVGRKKAYFVAIASMNADRVASSDANALQDALPRIWEGIRIRGGMENLLCPVLGSGYSRINLTRGELVKAIIRSFVVASQEGKLTEVLTIVLHPKDVKQGQIDLSDLRRFLECECVHGRPAQVVDVPTGTPLS